MEEEEEDEHHLSPTKGPSAGQNSQLKRRNLKSFLRTLQQNNNGKSPDL